MSYRYYLSITWIALLLAVDPSRTHEHHHDYHHVQDLDFARCGTRSPTQEESEAMYNEVKEWLMDNPDALTSQKTITICTWVHVIEFLNGTGGVSDERIDKQMRVLNEGFKGNGETNFCGKDPNGRPSQGGVSTAFEFVLAGTTRTRNDTWAKWNDTMDMDPMMALRRGDEATLNLYIVPFLWCEGGGALGCAPLPIDYMSSPIRDGVVVKAETVPGSNAGTYDEGDTTTHEVGHWLGLLHTFEGHGCVEPGDGVDDTPTQANSSVGCPTSTDSCPSPGLDPVTNFMDYSDDCCMSEFTVGQSMRMLAMWHKYRASGSACETPMPTVAPTPLSTPYNDMCFNATRISIPSSTMGSTTLATMDGDGIGPFCGTNITAPGVWYVFTATNTCEKTAETATQTRVEVSTCTGTFFDTKINVYTGSCEELSCIAGDDDGCVDAALKSYTAFDVQRGSKYYILVQGFLGDKGDFELDVNFVGNERGGC